MTSLVSASKLAIAEPRQQARKEGSKGNPAFQEAFRASGAERLPGRAAAIPASSSPMQGLAQRLDAFQKIAGFAAEKPADGQAIMPEPGRDVVTETRQPSTEQSKAQTAQVADPPSSLDAGAMAVAEAGGSDGHPTVARVAPDLPQPVAGDREMPGGRGVDPNASFDAEAPLAGEDTGRNERRPAAKVEERPAMPSPAPHTDKKSNGKPMPPVEARTAPDEVEPEATEPVDAADSPETVAEPETPDMATTKTDTPPAEPDAVISSWQPSQDARRTVPAQARADQGDASQSKRSASDGIAPALGTKERDTARQSQADGNIVRTVSAAPTDRTASPRSNGPREPASGKATEAALSTAVDSSPTAPSDASRSTSTVGASDNVKATVNSATADGQSQLANTASSVPSEPAAGRTAKTVLSNATDSVGRQQASRTAPAAVLPDQVKIAASDNVEATVNSVATDGQSQPSKTAPSVQPESAAGRTAALSNAADSVARQQVSRSAPAAVLPDQVKAAANGVAAAAPALPMQRGSGSEIADRKPSERPASGQSAAAATASTPADRLAGTAATAQQREMKDVASALPTPERAHPEQEPAQSDSGDDAKPSVAADPRPADAARPAAVTAVSAQATQPAAPAAPAAAVIASVRADPSWAAYFRDTRPGAGAQLNSLKIQLNPVELGNVTAHLQIKDDAVSVELTAETADAQRQLTSDADTIVKSLRALGLDIDRVTVQLATRADAQPQADASAQPRQQGFAADGGAGGTREQDGGSRERQQRQSVDPASPAPGQSAASSNRSSSARYI